MMAENRQFKRLSLELPARLSTDTRQCSVTIRDISLKGVLLQTGPHQNTAPMFSNEKEQPLRLEILSDPERVPILCMEIRPTRVDSHRIAGEWVDIDLTSLTNLRSLLDYNLGDDELSQRELPDLWQD